MTCIVGIIDKKNKSVIIGGDSAGTSGNDVTVRKDVKVFRNGDFLFGCTSSFRMTQLLRFKLKIPPVNKKDLYEYMCSDFVDAVRKCFKDGGYLKEDKGEESGGVFLAAYKNRLFSVQSDFQVEETVNGINAVGCGCNYALGSVFALKNKKVPIHTIVETALKAAENFSGAVRRPFVILSTHYLQNINIKNF